MKFSAIINYPLGLLGVKIVRVSRLKTLRETGQFLEANIPGNISDIGKDAEFMKIYEQVSACTMVGIERCYALYQSLLYIHKNKIGGDIVECGVWKGGSAMLMALVLLATRQTHRKIFLYDTFDGMAKPGPKDGDFEKAEWERLKKEKGGSDWCYSSLEETRENLHATGYPVENIVWVQGKVEETIPGTIPSQIALLRLDTDWYESTRHELEQLYPRLVKGGILIIDDYGAWQGARKAVDEYFNDAPNILLQRIDSTGRLIIKP